MPAHARQTSITLPPASHHHPCTLRPSSAYCRPPHLTQPPERKSPCELHTHMPAWANMGNEGALLCMLVTAETSHAEMSLLNANAPANAVPPRTTRINHHARTRAPGSHHTTINIPSPPSHTSTPHIVDHPIAYIHPREREPKRAPHTHAHVSQYGQQGRTTLHVGHGADIPRRDVAVESRCLIKHCATKANPHRPSCPHTRAKQPSHHHRYPTTTLAHSDRRRHIADHPI
jgi:hypothetical protein